MIDDELSIEFFLPKNVLSLTFVMFAPSTEEDGNVSHLGTWVIGTRDGFSDGHGVGSCGNHSVHSCHEALDSVAVEVHHVCDLDISEGLQDEVDVVEVAEGAPKGGDEVLRVNPIVVSAAGPARVTVMSDVGIVDENAGVAASVRRTSSMSAGGVVGVHDAVRGTRCS